MASRQSGPSQRVWLVRWKKATGMQAFDYDTAVTEALRYGWIDSVPRRLDDERSMLWFAPCKAGSGWSRANLHRIGRLQEQDRLEPAGRRAVEVAKEDGSWSLLDDVEDLVVPPDLAAALGDTPSARDRWESFPPSARRGILEWIVQAKRSATRAKRIRTTADEAADGRRANRWIPKDER